MPSLLRVPRIVALPLHLQGESGVSRLGQEIVAAQCELICVQVARFNLTHTVGDIRRFIHAARPDVTGPYRLMTAFPQAQLDNDSATIASAGLANAVIIQKL